MSAPPGFRAEFRATLRVALPLALGNLAMMAMGFTDAVMVGRLGAQALAAAGLGAAVYFTIGVAVQGVVTAVAPLAAHAIGSGDRAAAGRIAGAGLLLAGLLSLPFAAVVLAVDRLLLVFGYDAALAADIGRFLGAAAWGAPAFIAVGTTRSLLIALGHQRVVMLSLFAAIASNAGLNWVLIYGNLGMPALGIVGSGYATSINIWLSLMVHVLAIRCLPSLQGLAPWRAAWLLPRREIGRLLRLGLPIAGMMLLESGLFLAGGLLSGLLGAAALGAHQIALNCASITFMVPLGFAQAATVRVAHELGAGRPATARLAGFMALGLGAGFMLLAAVLLWTFPRAIIGVYIDIDAEANRELVQTALRLFVVAALFQVVDGMQVIAAGALRGFRDTAVPMLLAGVGYWGIGFAGGWILGFPLGLGVYGLWCGLGMGVGVVAVLLSVRLHLRSAAPPLTPAAAGHT